MPSISVRLGADDGNSRPPQDQYPAVYLGLSTDLADVQVERVLLCSILGFFGRRCDRLDYLSSCFLRVDHRKPWDMCAVDTI